MKHENGSLNANRHRTRKGPQYEIFCTMPRKFNKIPPKAEELAKAPQWDISERSGEEIHRDNSTGASTPCFYTDGATPNSTVSVSSLNFLSSGAMNLVGCNTNINTNTITIGTMSKT
jgi:hypothetical protein